LNVLAISNCFIALKIIKTKAEKTSSQYSLQQYWLLFLCFPIISFGQVSIQDTKQSYLLKDFTQIIETGADETIEGLLKGDKFSDFPLEDKDLEVGKVYWGKVVVDNKIQRNSKDTDWILKFSTSISRVDVYLSDGDNYQKVNTSGTLVPISQKRFATSKTNGNIIPITLSTSDNQIIYFRFLNEQMKVRLNISTELIPEHIFYIEREQQIRGQYIFTGLVLMIILLNIFQYFERRDSAFVYYTLYLISVLIFIMYTTGDLSTILEPIFFPTHPEYIYFVKSTVIYVAIVSYWAFIRYYFNWNEALIKWSKVLKFLSFLALPLLILEYASLIFFEFSPGISDYLSITYTAIFILCNVVFLVPIFRKGGRLGRFIAVGIAALICGFFLVLLSRVSSIDYSTVWMQLGIVIELSAFAFGLIDRGRQLEKKKRQAEFDLEKNKILRAKQEERTVQMQKVFDFQNRFYANFTHEFRSPLTVIAGVSKLIKGHEREKELLKRNSADLVELVDNVLTVGKAQSGNFILRPQKINLINYLQKQLKHFRSVADVKQIQIQTDLPLAEYSYSVDVSAFRLIISNLLENAIKYSDEGGNVFFSLQRKADTAIKIEVKDVGVGISDKEMPFIFERYYQSRTHRRTGSGLGLSVVKELVELMNGTLKVKSELGIGTTFQVELPIKMEENGTTKLIPESREEENIQKELATILVADDHKDILEYIEALLGKEFELILANDGASALEKTFQFIPDIVISDVNMPNLNGLELCSQLKKDARTDHIPVILLTAKTRQKDRLEGLREGADVYLNKPFDAEELKIRVRELLKLRAKLQESYQNKNEDFNDTKTVEGEFLTKLRELVVNRISDESLHTEDLCKIVNLGYTQTYRKLKALTGQSPVQFIRAIRMDEAYKILNNEDLSISEVAYRVGFNDPNYFSRVFTQTYGRSPKNIKRD